MVHRVSSAPPAPEPADILARRLAVLDAVSAALAEVVDLSVLLERALDIVLDITGVDGGGIFLFEERENALRLAAQRGVSQRLTESFAANPGPTLHGIVSNSEAAVIVRDLHATGTPRQELLLAGVRSYAGIPLHGQALGAMVVLSSSMSDFNHVDVRLLAAIGRQLGFAIERARLYARERRRVQQLETISEVGRRLGAIHSERELLSQIVRYVCRHLGYESANLLLLDGARSALVLEAAVGLGNDGLEGHRIPLDEQRSLAGWVVARGEPLLANDVSREPRHHRGSGQERAELAVPIQASGRTLGVLDVQASHVGAFDENDVSVLQILAGQIAVAIENARLHEATQHALRRARAFQAVTAALTESLDLQTTLDRTLQAAMEVFEADRAAIFQTEAGGRRMSCTASRGLSTEFLTAVTTQYETNDWPDVLDNVRSLFVEDTQATPLTPALRETMRRAGVRSMLYLSLPHGRARLGTLVLYHDRSRRYSEQELALAHTFADQANIALQHARLFEAERRAREQASRLVEATRMVTALLHREDVLMQAGRSIAAALGRRACAIWLLNEQRTAFLPAYRVTSRPNLALDEVFRRLPPIPVDASPRVVRLVHEQTPYIAGPDDAISPAERTIQEMMPFTAYVAIPLGVRDRLVGVAAVPFDRVEAIDQAGIEFAMAIARSTALALENARLYEQSTHLAANEERNRLARDLHDSVTHSLFSMTLIAQAVPRLMERDRDRARERLERLAELGRGALAEMRALIFQLRPAALEEQGLAVALENYLAAFESREGVDAELTVEGKGRLPLAVEKALFRIAQEALNNVAKHARATRVTVRLVIAADCADLTVADDGCGFDPAAALGPVRTSLGMTSMRERAQLLDGACAVESGLGSGTVVSVHIPQGRRAEES